MRGGYKILIGIILVVLTVLVIGNTEPAHCAKGPGKCWAVTKGNERS